MALETVKEKTFLKQFTKIKVLEKTVEIFWDEITTIVTKEKEAGTVLGTVKKRKEKKEIDHHNRPHEDFHNALNMLRKPVIDICEFGNFKEFLQYIVQGITLIGMDSDETAGVMIHAGKAVDWSGQEFFFTTPKLRFLDEKYSDGEKVDKYCKRICEEAQLFLDGKHAAPPQMQLEFEGGEKVDMAVEDHDRPV